MTDGQVTLFLGDRQVLLGAGAFALAPPDLEHAFRFEAPDTRLLLLIGPGADGHEALFRDLSQPIAVGGAAPTGGHPPDFVPLGEVAARHGTRLAGPPPSAST